MKDEFAGVGSTEQLELVKLRIFAFYFYWLLATLAFNHESFNPNGAAVTLIKQFLKARHSVRYDALNIFVSRSVINRYKCECAASLFAQLFYPASRVNDFVDKLFAVISSKSGDFYATSETD